MKKLGSSEYAKRKELDSESEWGGGGEEGGNNLFTKKKLVVAASQVVVVAARETGGACGDETSNRERPPSFGHWRGMEKATSLPRWEMAEFGSQDPRMPVVGKVGVRRCECVCVCVSLCGKEGQGGKEDTLAVPPLYLVASTKIWVELEIISPARTCLGPRGQRLEKGKDRGGRKKWRNLEYE